MIRRREALEVFTRLSEILSSGRAAALATLIEVDGAGYRRPGARLLIERDGPFLGGLSAGCVEEDVRLHGLECLDQGRARLLDYDLSSLDAFGLSLGCDGRLHVLIRPFQSGQAVGIATLAAALAGDETVALALAIPGADFAAVAQQSGVLTESGDHAAVRAAHAALMGRSDFRDMHVDRLEPQPALVVCGAGSDSVPIVRLAESVGFRVIVADHRAAALSADRFSPATRFLHVEPELHLDSETVPPGAFALVKCHDYARDLGWLRHLRDTDVAYIGLMGPRTRVDRLQEEVGRDRRIFGPTGLDLGAEGAEQIAVAVVAELLAVSANRSAGHLRDRRRPIHART